VNYNAFEFECLFYCFFLFLLSCYFNLKVNTTLIASLPLHLENDQQIQTLPASRSVFFVCGCVLGNVVADDELKPCIKQ
jgi:hypothetical protein